MTHHMSGDQIIRCAECGVAFVWTEGEGLADPARPARCPACRRLAPAPGRERGLVKWFSRARGYGFVTAVGGDDVFVHKSGLAEGQPLPRAGQLVEFGVGRGPRGAQAEALVVLEAG